MCLSAGKKATSSPMLFWRYYDMQTYFGYFGQAWPCTPKMIVSTCGKLQCLSACQKYTSLFPAFLRYYILKNLAIWLTDSILANNSRTRILPVMGLVVKYQYISLHFRLFSGKLNDKNFQKIQKTIFWGHFGPFLPKFGQKWIFLEKRALSVFKYSDYLP